VSTEHRGASGSCGGERWLILGCLNRLRAPLKRVSIFCFAIGRRLSSEMKLLFAICQGGGNGDVDVREGRWNIGYSRGQDRGTGCFNGPTPCGILWLEALRGTFEIRPSSWECGGETRGEGDTEKYQRICGTVINLSARLSEA
jgi:hypothetical protein